MTDDVPDRETAGADDPGERGFEGESTAVEAFDDLGDNDTDPEASTHGSLESLDDFSSTDRVDSDRFRVAFDQADVVPALVVLSGARVGETKQLERGRTVLGRNRARADVWFRDGGVSRVHAAVVLDEAGARVRDLDSSNGTFVNGERAEPVAGLDDGDKIALGKRTILRYGLLDDFDEQFQRRLYESTIRDEVSGAYSRAYLEDKMRSEMSFARRHGHPVTVVMLDIDHFKTINDDFGHVAGDAVLSQMVDAIRDELRTEDLVARFGGDEFAVLLRQTDADTGGRVAERIRDRIGATTFETEAAAISSTLSAGIAQFEPEGMGSVEDWLRAADEALYRAKAAGRDTSRAH